MYIENFFENTCVYAWTIFRDLYVYVKLLKWSYQLEKSSLLLVKSV